jgi:MoxR-like ATPase
MMSEQMPVPPYQAFVDPLLRVLDEHPEGLRTSAAHEALAQRLGLSDSDRTELLPSGQQAAFKNRNGWAHDRLKRAGLSESSAFGTWRLTKAGVAFVRAHKAPLTEAQVKSITDISEENQAVVWRERLAAFRADTTWAAERDATNATRDKIRPQILETLRRYLSGASSLEDFRATFDLKTRREWSCFGAKGLSGAMVLNQLAKHAPDAARADSQLKALVVEPSDEGAAARALRSFMAYLETARVAAEPGARLPQSGRLKFFASSFWHIQAPDEWPPFYSSARTALAADGLYDPAGLDVADDYLAYRRAFMQLQKALDVSSWDLESLLRWTQRDDDGSGPTDPDDDEAEEATGQRVWLIALGRNADQWETCHRDGIIAIGWNAAGDLLQYPSIDAIRARLREDRETDVDPMNAGLACWQFAREMRPGDTVYVKRGRHFIVGHGVVTSSYRHDPKRPLANIREVRWLGRGEWKPREKALAMKTLTEIGKYPGLLKDIRAAIGATDGETGEVDVDKKPIAPPYGFEDAEKDLFLTREHLREIVELCRYKKNIIIQGPPGVGKTFVATRLAHLLIGSTNEDQVQRVQFHPSYSYEDFVQGLRPAEGGGFVRKDGPLLRFCKDALEDQASPYVLIIDEINRGNVSKILGELLSLIEADKRDLRYGVTLAYARDDEPRFHVPPNLFVIGMMNTADRSLAFVDYALRRRFVFVDLEPAFGTERFDADLTRRGVEAALRKAIQERLVGLNERIVADPTLGPGFRVGHSYFCQRVDAYDEAWFRRIVDYEIAPLLREYWFDSPAKLDQALAELRGG